MRIGTRAFDARITEAKRHFGRWLLAPGLTLLFAFPGLCQEGSQPAVPPEQASETETASSGSSDEPFVQRVRDVGDALRGLASWDLFKGRVTLRIYTRFQLDGTVARANGALEQTVGLVDENSLNIRRLNLYAAGEINGHLDYTVGYLFGPDASIWNAYVQGIGRERGLSVFGYHVGSFRFGYFQEPFSVERSTSSYYTGFAERSLPVWAFAPGNNLGYMVFNTALNDRLSWALGFFTFGQTTELNPVASSLSANLRLTGRPIYFQDGRRMVHVGVAYSNRQPLGGTVQFRVRPEARFVDFFADTGEIAATLNRLYQAEGVYLEGPLWIQSEIIVSQVKTSTETLQFSGSYVQAGLFLTGERRPFNTKEAYFGRVVPLKKHALEVVGRLSKIDLNDGDVQGGRFTDLGFGLNWYIGSTSRLMVEYTHARVEDSGTANIALLRFAWRPRSR